MSGIMDKIYQHSPIWAQQVITVGYGYYWYQRRYGATFHDFAALLRTQEHLSAAEYRAYQEKRLGDILAVAQRSPYYREVFAAHDIQAGMSPFEALQRMPVLTKSTLHTHALDLLTEPAMPRDARMSRSSGTTGTPTEIIHPGALLQKGQGWIEARSRNWTGLDYHSRRVMFGARKICRFDQAAPPFWRISPRENMAYMSIYHLSPTFLPSYVAFLRAYKPDLIMGYPSALSVFARYVLTANDFPAPAKAIITTSEAVTLPIRTMLEKVWKCQVFATYGSVEHCAFASQCEHGNYHLSPEVGIVEVLDAAGNLCPPGQPGTAICTGLHNDLQPLIRYEIGDVLTPSDKTGCPCGRTLPLVDSIDGRLESMCYLPDGRMTLRFDTVFKGVASIWEAQVVQDKIDRFRIRVVPGDGFGESDITLLKNNMKLHAGDVHVDIEAVEQIERTASGKFQAVVCNLSAEEIEQVLQDRL